MIFRIQDPKYPTAPSLHESLLEICQGAISGGGAFAFASKEGVDLFLRDEIFTDFAKAGRFELIVGVDETTNVRALEALSEIGLELPSLTVKVFHHDLVRTVFHPKFCWFRHKSKGFLITGSGNLTARGLRSNWEAFTISTLNLKEMDEVERQWAAWVASHSGWLKPPDDAEVLARAALNVWRAAARAPRQEEVAPTAEPEAEPESDDLLPEPLLQEDAVLVAEIPRSGDRWNQANFDLDTFRNFFGAREGTTQRVLLQHVNADGMPGVLESRPSVAVKSQNYRFELEAAAGLPYPQQGRPIGVFVRLATRAFKYRLVMPDDPHYPTVLAFLQSQWRGRADRMRRVVRDVSTVRGAWPDSPLWRVT